MTSASREDSIPPMVRSSATLLGTIVLFVLAGCAQTDPVSVCEHIAGLQPSGGAPKDYVRRCLKPMNEAKFSHPEEYRCWSKCVVEVKAWPDSARCDPCVEGKSAFEIFQYTKARQKQEDARKAQTSPSAAALLPPPSASSSAPAAVPSSSAPAPAASMCGDSQPCK